jgi:hypothetical protein
VNGPLPPTSPDERLKLVFDEALRALTQQAARLDNMRSRATTLTAAAALISSFLGGTTVRTQAVTWPTLLAAGAVGIVLVCTLLICAPFWHWNFYISTPQLLQAVDAGFDLDEMRRNLATDFDQWVEKNDRKLARMHWLFMTGLVFLVVEMAAWSVTFWQVWGDLR